MFYKDSQNISTKTSPPALEMRDDRTYSFLSFNYLENPETFFIMALGLNVAFVSLHSTLFLEIFSNLSSKIPIEMRVGLQVKCLLFLPSFNQISSCS